jgi:hypothetical protein
MRAAEGFGAAGPPRSTLGTVLNFGRYAGWSLGEVARHDIEYIEWLDRAPIGRNYRQEVDEILRSSGRRVGRGRTTERRGLTAGASSTAGAGWVRVMARSTIQPTVVP